MRKRKQDMMKTDGARRLGEWLKDNETTQAAFALHLGLSGAAVSRWVSGALRPEPAHRDAIARATGIEADAWLSAAEKRLIDRAGRPVAAGR